VTHLSPAGNPMILGISARLMKEQMRAYSAVWMGTVRLRRIRRPS
jgi:hypothetical protein